MLNDLLNFLTNLLKEQSLITPIIAFIAGLISSIMPCSLASIPLIIGYVKGSGQEDTKKSFILSIIFSLGMSITFIAIGVLSILTGRLIGNIGAVIYFIMGIFLVLMAVQIWGIYYFIKPTSFVNKSKSKDKIGALVSGVLAGFFSSPCSTPVIFALVSITMTNSSNLYWGLILFIAFAFGHSVINILAGTFSTFVGKLMVSKGYKKLSVAIEFILGALVFLLGIYFIYLGI